MTRAAKIDRVHRIEPLGIQDGAAAGVDVSLLHRRDVAGSRPMAGFTRDPRRNMRNIKLIGRRGTRGVATETPSRFYRIEPSPHCDLDIFGPATGVPGGEIQSLQGPVETQAALIKITIALVDIGLAL